MMDYKINAQEREALRGLPYLQRLLYYEGIRPFMDFTNGIVGLRRGISYQSLAEELYVEPHPGYQGGQPSKDQLRRALRGLQKAGLIELQSDDQKLVLQCKYASQDFHAQNKAAMKPPHQVAPGGRDKKCLPTTSYEHCTQEAATSEKGKAAIPPVYNNSLVFLFRAFQMFWQVYPEKKSKQKTWEVFQKINPSAELFQKIMHNLQQQCRYYQQQISAGHWMAHWKHPANWLEQHCWEDELSVNHCGDPQHEINRTRKTRTQTPDLLWESCKDGFEDKEQNKRGKIVDIAQYRCSST